MSLSDWVGSLVSIDCGDTLGTYQGQVSAVDAETQALSITKAYRNGIQCSVPVITLNAADICDLKILKRPSEVKDNPILRHGSGKGSFQSDLLTPTKAPTRSTANKHNGLTPTDHGNRKLPANRRSPKQSRSSPSNGYTTPNKPNNHQSNHYSVENGFHTNGDKTHASSDEYPFRKRTSSVGESTVSQRKGKHNNVSTPKKINQQQENGHQRFQRKPRNDCFSAPAHSILDDFDFEKNLALFDKQAVFEEIETQGYPKIVRPSSTNQPAKYKCDENVLQSNPVTYRQIEVPCSTGCQYVTDSGLVVPSINYELRSRLFEIAVNKGVSTTRQLELVGRSASEMVLQLIGGSHRMTPKNAHQKPRVVVLCGPHIQGAQGVNCARQLVMHGVDVTLFVPNFMKVLDELQTELNLFELTDSVKKSFAKDLPDMPVDMIVSALDSHENSVLSSQAWYTSVVSWANQSKASVLALDPPVDGGAIDVKWSLSLGLPLNYNEKCGQVCLCDLAIPTKVWTECNIKYMSPFGHKFCIALHPSS